MKKGNLYSNIPDGAPEELLTTLTESGQVRIERIVSYSHASPEGFWYDQEENEWVILLQGRARLRFESGGETFEMGPGDWVEIPSHVRHRVDWTDKEQKTVWLAVFFGGHSAA